MVIVVGIFIECVLIALLMGYFILYARAKANQAVFEERADKVNALHARYLKEKYSGIWHGIGLFIRNIFVIITFVSFWDHWYYAILSALISIFLSWTAFDRIINIIIGNNFWYIDSRNINKFLGKAYWVITILLIVVTIYWAIQGQKYF